MAYTPHAVKISAGAQPALVEEAYIDYDPGRPGGAQYKLRVNAVLLGNISARQRLRGIAFVGTLTANNISNDLSQTASGGFYDPLMAFLVSNNGGSLTDTEARDYVVNRVMARQLMVQIYGGRLVAT